MHNSTAKFSASGVGSCSKVALQMSSINFIDVLFCSQVKKSELLYEID
jgi:hypothetical protein